jgi:hypothetical protein
MITTDSKAPWPAQKPKDIFQRVNLSHLGVGKGSVELNGYGKIIILGSHCSPQTETKKRVIKRDGNMAIGTSEATRKLTVSGGCNASKDSGHTMQHADQLANNSSIRFLCNGRGSIVGGKENFGIGTFAPKAKPEVACSLRLASSFHVQGAPSPSGTSGLGTTEPKAKAAKTSRNGIKMKQTDNSEMIPMAILTLNLYDHSICKPASRDVTLTCLRSGKQGQPVFYSDWKADQTYLKSTIKQQTTRIKS